MHTYVVGHKLVIVGLITLSLFTGFLSGHYHGTGTFPLPERGVSTPAISEASLMEAQLSLAPMKEREYAEGFNCVDFAWEAMRVLRWAGKESEIALLVLEPSPNHALLLVPTADAGWVFVEPQSGLQTKPQVGGRYFGRTITAIHILQFTTVSLEEFLSGTNES